MNLPELVDDPRFTSNAARVRHRHELDPLLEARSRLRGKRDWLDALEAAGVPCGPINSIGEVFAETQIAAREMVVELPHPTAGNVRLVGNPIKLSRTPVSYRSAPPLLGEQTDAVLDELLGLSPEEIARLRENGVV